MIAAGGTESDAIILWGGVLIVAICLLGVFVWRIRRWFFKTPETSDGSDWTLAELRDLKKRGRITEAEYQALRVRVLADAGVSPEAMKRATSADDAQPAE